MNKGTDSESFFVRSGTCIRPLVSRWPATEHLIPPVQSALSLNNVQLPLLRSYVDAPEYHWKAARTPELIGGPWVDIEPERVAEVERLIEWMETGQRDRLELVRDLRLLDELLRSSARGGSMTSLYPRVPSRLRGYVELVYDIGQQPQIRLLESLLYRSAHYRPDLQSVALRSLHGDHRPPEFTTPVLDSDPDLCVSIPWSSEGLDMLFAARRHPQPLGMLVEALGLPEDDHAQFRRLLTTSPPAPSQQCAVEGLRLRYFGHACVVLETRDVSIVMDPLVGYECPSGPARWSWSDLPESIDFAVLTHMHKDHFNLETLLALRHRVRRVVIPGNDGGRIQDPSFRRALEAIGFEDVVEVDSLETLELPGGRLTALPFLGEHADFDIGSKAAWHVQLGERSVLCAADSANVDPVLYRHVHDLVGDVDVLYLGMECVGAPLTVTYGGLLLRPLSRTLDQERRTIGSDFEGAMDIIDRFHPKHVYIYAMGLEPWLGHLLPIESSRDALGVLESDRVISVCRARGIVADRPHCMAELVLALEGGA